MMSQRAPTHLNLSIREGETVRVGDKKLTVASVEKSTRTAVVYLGETRFEIRENSHLEIDKLSRLSVWKVGQKGKRLNATIAAPRNVPVRRLGKLGNHADLLTIPRSSR